MPQYPEAKNFKAAAAWAPLQPHWLTAIPEQTTMGYGLRKFVWEEPSGHRHARFLFTTSNASQNCLRASFLHSSGNTPKMLSEKRTSPWLWMLRQDCASARQGMWALDETSSRSVRPCCRLLPAASGALSSRTKQSCFGTSSEGSWGSLQHTHGCAVIPHGSTAGRKVGWLVGGADDGDVKGIC